MVAAIRKLTNTLRNSKHVWEEAESWEKTAKVSASGKVDGKMGRWPPYQGTGRREGVASTGGRCRELQMLF